MTSTIPAADQTGVGVDVLPRIGFSRAVDLLSADAGMQLTVAGTAVERTANIEDHDQRVALIPRNTLPPNTDVVLDVAGTVHSLDGVRLGAAVELTFHTAP